MLPDAGCATVAEVRKRGDDFWGEFEFYLSDLVVGCVLDCVLVGLLAPSAVIGAKPKTKPSGEPTTPELSSQTQCMPYASIFCAFEAAIHLLSKMSAKSHCLAMHVKHCKADCVGLKLWAVMLNNLSIHMLV